MKNETTIVVEGEVISLAKKHACTPGMDVRGGSAAGDKFGKDCDRRADEFFAALGRSVLFAATRAEPTPVTAELVQAKS